MTINIDENLRQLIIGYQAELEKEYYQEIVDYIVEKKWFIYYVTFVFWNGMTKRYKLVGDIFVEWE